MRLTLTKTKRVEVPGDIDGGYVNIKALSLDEIANIESKSSDITMNGDSGVLMSINPYKRANLIARECITGWGNFFDEKGNELKYSKSGIGKISEYSVKIDGKSVRFMEWVDVVHSEFVGEVGEETGEAEKN